uniref:Uncharacterized protein n=1 Tax=Candidatus Kentrum sp. LFY TaxID=2126342 RepID=A0A450UZK2_9GAMM|nr:MAG: hypothetical protein BECKLFY1418A_GA0070994_107413 [Candidatus Kentron sp. LFY]
MAPYGRGSRGRQGHKGNKVHKGQRGIKGILVRLDRKGRRANGDSRDQWVRGVCREIRVKRGCGGLREIRDHEERRGKKGTQEQQDLL